MAQINDNEWLKKTMMRLQELNLGWYKKIKSILDKYDLPTNLNDIKTHTPNEWKRRVKFVVESESRARLKQDCYKKDGNDLVEKTKTKSLIDKINNNEYTRSPDEELL